MPFTTTLGTELLVLSQRELDLLITLESNLAMTRQLMQDITERGRAFGLLAATQLNNSVAHDLGILAQAFEAFAPDRKLTIDEQEPALASDLLRRLASAQTPATDRNGDHRGRPE